MTGRTAPSSEGLLAEVFKDFPQSLGQMPGNVSTAPGIILLSPLSSATEVTDVTLRASDLWLRTRTVVDDTDRLN